MSIGMPEMVLLFVLALLVFGPHKLPEIGRTIGQAMRELRRMSSEVTGAFQDAMQEPPVRPYGHEWKDSVYAEASDAAPEEGPELQDSTGGAAEEADPYLTGAEEAEDGAQAEVETSLEQPAAGSETRERD